MKKKTVKVSDFSPAKFKNLRFIFLTIFLVCFLAYGLTLDMYFWKDDFALMIKAQHPQEPVGFFGPGIKGDGAYRYITIPFSLLYPYFQLNASAYFFVGIFLYFISAVGVFVLANEIFQDGMKSYLATLIYSSGYIGADSIFGLTNSYQTSWVALFLTLSLTLFLKSFRTKNLGLYILSVFIFAAAVETGYVRAHGFFLIVLSSAFLLLSKFEFKQIILFVFKIFPFFLIFKSFYLSTTPAQVGSGQLSKSLESGNYDYFLNPLITFINVIIPTPLIKFSSEFIFQIIGRNISATKINFFWFIVFLIFFLSLVIFLIVKKRFSAKFPETQSNIRIILFGLSSILGSFIGVFFIGAAATYLESTHRYLSTALISLSFFWVALFSLISKKEKYKLFIPVIILCLLYLVFGNLYALQSINSRTKPQKEFFSQLKKEIPEINGKTFLYFDVSNKNNSQGKFGNIFGAGSVGGSPEITVHYPGVDRYDVVMSIADFKDFTKKILENNGSIDRTYAFYFEDNKLINKTSQVREILKRGKITPIKLSNNLNHKVSVQKKDDKFSLADTTFEIEIPGDISTISDGILKFNLQIDPNLPDEQIEEKLSPEDQKILRYLISKYSIKKNSSAVVFNHFQNQEQGNLFDGKIDTTWMANRGPWHNITHGVTNEIQYIEVFLSSPINLGGILFTNGHKLRTPTEYRILFKQGNKWEEIKKAKLTSDKNTNEIWFEKINPIFTDSIRIEILNSESGDAPQLSELELVENQFSDIDFNKAIKIELDPSILLEKNPFSFLIRNYFENYGKLSFSYLSNKDNDYNVPRLNFDVKGFYTKHQYEIPVAGNGTKLIKIRFSNLNFPANYIFSDFEYINPALKEMMIK